MVRFIDLTRTKFKHRYIFNLYFDFRDCTGSHSTIPVFAGKKSLLKSKQINEKKNCTANVNSSISRKCCVNSVKKYSDTSRIWGLFICLHLVCLSKRKIERERQQFKYRKHRHCECPTRALDIFHFVIGFIICIYYSAAKRDSVYGIPLRKFQLKSVDICKQYLLF